MKKLTVGILAHVDAGKTTLSEALLYVTGSIRKLGRVDHRDTFLDTHSLERARGITIFSKQAILNTTSLADCPDCEITLLDTPGHSDFSAETERTLGVLDAAVLVISGTDGVQAHTETLWQLLQRYHVPVFVFVTKMDVSNFTPAQLLADLKTRLHPDFFNFTAPPHGDTLEELAMLDETLLDLYMDSGRVTESDIARLIADRKLFPCCFGSGLKLDGIEHFLDILTRYTVEPAYPAEFGARIYKIGRDGRGNRLTYLKVTGGTLTVRDSLRYTPHGAKEPLEEKAAQLRRYSGEKFETITVAPAGTVVAVSGLSATWPGQGLGFEHDGGAAFLEPAMGYRLMLPKDCDEKAMLPKLRQLEEEDPMLRIVYDADLGEIQLQLMGAVQIDILRELIRQRFDVEVQIGAGRILYRETIADAVMGVGHFEPLRHYAEVQLLLEPAPRGSGLLFTSTCPEDVLDLNWQRLILSNLEEKQHRGVLTGYPLTDVKITLLTGRAHLKHTEGGDFRQAACRAVRQGLMQAESVLLEPYFAFRLDVPAEQIGRAISDIRAMGGTHDSPDATPDGTRMILTGTAPVAEMYDYAAEVVSYTRGQGRLSCHVDGYMPCHNAQAVIDEIGYDPERDVENTPDSVFCAHGAGHTVGWREVHDYMHTEPRWKPHSADPTPAPARPRITDIDEKELEAILLREFGPIRRPVYSAPSVNSAMDVQMTSRKPERLIIDGYNVIHAWPELKAMAEDSYDLARTHLIDMLANYQAFTKTEIVLVFDAYRQPGEGSRDTQGGLHIAYTKEGETADMYIEKLTADIGKNERVRVVSSDNLIQLTSLRTGVRRVSSGEFKTEVDWALEQISQIVARSQKP